MLTFTTKSGDVLGYEFNYDKLSRKIAWVDVLMVNGVEVEDYQAPLSLMHHIANVVIPSDLYPVHGED